MKQSALTGLLPAVVAMMLLAMFLTLALLAGCSSSMQIRTDFSESADFSQIKTFHYVESEQNLSRTSPLQHQRVVEAINTEMTRKGYVDAGMDADVFVTYFASVGERVVLTTTGMAHHRGGRWHGGWHSGMMHTSTTTAQTIQTGTLDIDIWDAKRNELIWRGQVSDTVRSTPDKNADLINRAVHNTLRRFPPK